MNNIAFSKPTSGRKRMLVVDDDANTAQTFVALLDELSKRRASYAPVARRLVSARETSAR